MIAAGHRSAVFFCFSVLHRTVFDVFALAIVNDFVLKVKYDLPNKASARRGAARSL